MGQKSLSVFLSAGFPLEKNVLFLNTPFKIWLLFIFRIANSAGWSFKSYQILCNSRQGESFNKLLKANILASSRGNIEFKINTNNYRTIHLTIILVKNIKTITSVSKARTI